MGGTLRDHLAPDGGYIGACVLTCVLVGGALRDHLAPDGGYIGACALTCLLVGGIDHLAQDGGCTGAAMCTFRAASSVPAIGVSVPPIE